MYACMHAYINAGQYNCATCQCTNASRCCPFVHMYVFVSSVCSRIQSSISHILKPNSQIIIVLFLMPFNRQYIINNRGKKTKIRFFSFFYFFILIIITHKWSRVITFYTEKKCERMLNKVKRICLFVTYICDVYWSFKKWH
jgi:hypothetical protein